MAGTDYRTLNVIDDRLNVTSTLNYGVYNGPQNNTYYQYNATSASASALVFNAQLPSQQTVINRRIPIRSTVALSITLYNATAAAIPAPIILGYGSNGNPVGNGQSISTALAPFPIHQCMQNQTMTFNNSNVSLQTRDLLPAMLRFQDSRALQRYNSTAPTMYDSYYSYNDCVGANNNPNAGFSTSADPDLIPRGAHLANVTYLNAGVVTPVTMAVLVAANSALLVTLTFTSVEPLLISPLMFADSKLNTQGLYGLSIINAVFNIGDASRVLRTNQNVVPTGTLIGSITAGQTAMSVAFAPVPFTDTSLLFNFLTPKPTLLLPAKNILPYNELSRYITAVGSIPFSDRVSTATISTNSQQINGIPDACVMFVRKRIGSQINSDSDAALPIRSISLQFNAAAGILSTATTQDLFNMSCQNGSNQNWKEFYGYAMSGSGSVVSSVIPTCGSYLILNFGKDIQIPEGWLAPGSLGSFNFQASITVNNNTGADIAANAYEVVTMFVQSGLFVTTRGSSAPYLNILSMEDVVFSAQQQAVPQGVCRRMVGGGFWDTLSSVAGKAKDLLQPLAPIAKMALASSADPRAQTAAKVIGALGGGISGGGISGGERDRRMM